MSFVSATKQSILNLVAQDGGPTGVVAGNYTNTSLTVDENGRIMDASSGAGGAGPANPTQDIGATAKNGTDLTFMRSDAAPALEPFGLGAATYNYATVQVDATGRVQSASNGSAPPAPANPTQDIGAMAVNGTDLTFMRSDAAPALEPFGLGAATYNYATVTVDATGRVQSASSGSPIVSFDAAGDTGISQTINDGSTLNIIGKAGLGIVMETKAAYASVHARNLFDSSRNVILVESFCLRRMTSRSDERSVVFRGCTLEEDGILLDTLIPYLKLIFIKSIP